jgi:hypothetical protein
MNSWHDRFDAMAEGTQHFDREMTTDLEVGVRLFSATLSMGTSALASGK